MRGFDSLRSVRQQRPSGFTLVELLVVIAIIGILVGLLLPAVNAAREAGRQTQCSNSLKNLGLGAQQHLDAAGHFPSGGWGNNWVGDPTRSFGKKQPGGWIYNLLPFTEYSSLHDLSLSATTNVDRSKANSGETQTPMALFICPTRRRAELYPFANDRTYLNMDFPASGKCAKTDYAINTGTADADELTSPASTLAQGDDPKTAWPNPTKWNGISFIHSEISAAAIPDGLSNTILIGEKEVDPMHYRDGSTACDNHCIVAGMDNDMFRKSDKCPVRDRANFAATDEFGSAHAGICIFVFCDGSVHKIAYTVELQTFNNLGSRNDHQPIDPTKF